MTREEFESILEEAYIEGYNTAIEDIQEDILDEEAYNLEDEYDYYTESNSKRKKELRELANKELNSNPKFDKVPGYSNYYRFDDENRYRRAIIGKNGKIIVSNQDHSGKNSYSKNNSSQRDHDQLNSHDKFYNSTKHNMRFGLIYGNRNK